MARTSHTLARIFFLVVALSAGCSRHIQKAPIGSRSPAKHHWFAPLKVKVDESAGYTICGLNCQLEWTTILNELQKNGYVQQTGKSEPALISTTDGTQILVNTDGVQIAEVLGVKKVVLEFQGVRVLQTGDVLAKVNSVLPHLKATGQLLVNNRKEELTVLLSGDVVVGFRLKRVAAK